MSSKRINEFSKKLKALDNHLGFKVLENTEANLNGSFVSLSKKGNVLITYGNDEGHYYSKHFPKILTGWESVYTTGRHVIESEGQHE